MSLLVNRSEQKFIEIAQLVFQEQFRRDPKLELELDERRKRLMYDDVVYNISFLMASVYLNDEKIFIEYAKWVYELLCNIMKDLDRDRIMAFMVIHYEVLADILNNKANGILSEDELKQSVKRLNLAIEMTKKTVTEITLSTRFYEGEYFKLRKAYLDALLKGETKEAHQIISDAKKQGVSIVDIYENILADTMIEIGSLWHQNIITIDKEHYATSVTQTIMASFYDEIFEKPKNNKVLLACAVGSELHEMGIRMLSDLFEYRGWDTIYLGAALPNDSILKAIAEHKPDLVALSVTMPVYLVDCREITESIRSEFHETKIAVGGQAFTYTDDIWMKWGVDYYSKTAIELAEWADKSF